MDCTVWNPLVNQTISCSPSLLLHYHRLNWLLLVVNLCLLTIGLLKWLFVKLVTKLTFIDCIKQFNRWNLAQKKGPTGGYFHVPLNGLEMSFTTKRHYKDRSISPNSVRVMLEDNVTCPVTVTAPSPTNNGKNGSIEEDKTHVASHQRADVLMGRLINEIIPQSVYLTLFILYLAAVFELAILITLGMTNSDSNSDTRTVWIELATLALTIIIHLFHYGFCYGKYLWLTEVNKTSQHQQVFHLTLHSLALAYFTFQLIGNIGKIVLTGAVFRQSKQSFNQLIRPYVSIMIIILQLYVAIRHLFSIYHLKTRRYVEDEPISKSPKIKYNRLRSTFLSMITFTWFIPILQLGYFKTLEIGDLGSLPVEEHAVFQFERFYHHYKQIDIHKYRQTFLWRVCWRTYKKSLIFGAIIKILSDLSSLVGPMSIGYILSYISMNNDRPDGGNASAIDLQLSRDTIHMVANGTHLAFLTYANFFHNAYVMAVIVLITTLLQSTFSNNFNHLVISEGIHLKSALNFCIYDKALRMPVSSSGIDVGVFSNYMSVDSSNIFQFFTMMHYLWAVPIKIGILLYLLYKQMGISSLIGASMFFLLAPFQYYCSRQISKIQKLQMNVSDHRLSKTTELFMGIKLLKLLGWELSFAEQIKRYRGEELAYLKKDAIYVAINSSAILVTLITFTLFPYIEKQPLSAVTVFTSIALINQITVPLYIVPLVIPMLVSAIVSHRRLVDYFSIEELNTNCIQWLQGGSVRQYEEAPNSAPILPSNTHKMLDRSRSALTTRPTQLPSLHLCCTVKGNFFRKPNVPLPVDSTGAKLAWYDEECSKSPTLLDINLQVPRNQLTIVVGSIGCGKSTLLSSLIGETFLMEGKIEWLAENNKSFGYVPSNPWILNVSLRENITFGRQYERKRYEEVVKACCLQADIDLLPYGDGTAIGERGITLSGGQKQRIALARAIYSSAPTLILDDALSALDPIVGYSVFDNAIIRLAIKHQRRTVILATHKHEFLSNADYVLVMEAGTIRNQGTLQQIEKSDKEFAYHWNVIKEKEIRERLCQKPRTCKTTEERGQLVRMLSKKGEFRGPVKRECQTSMMRKPKLISRQMSYDASNALPYNEWTNCDEVIHESELEMSCCSLKQRFNRHFSNDSDVSQSFNESLNSNSCTELNLPSQLSNQSLATVRPTFSRINSRISNYSYGANSIIEEEDDNEHRLDLDDLLDEEDSSSFSTVEDATIEATNELLCEITSFNENQVDNATIYNGDQNPRTSQISLDVYRAYLQAHSYSLSAAVILLVIANQALKLISDFWLAKWTDKDEHRLKDSVQNQPVTYYIYAYITLSLISVVISLCTNIFAQLIAIRAVRLLHDNLLDTLVRCSLRFFDKTPIGRIINRFTNDVNVIDKKLPISIPVLLRFLFLCLSAIVVNIIITPYFLVAVIPILVIYYYIQKIFRCTSRQLQRLELSSKSPIISHFNQTIDGLTTIRAFREQSMFCDKFFQLLDINNLCFLLVNSANCCLGIALDYLGGIILFVANLISITAALYWNVGNAFVGLAMAYTLLVPVYLNWLVRNLAMVEMNMNSVERIYRYTLMDTENSNKPKDAYKSVPEDWPKHGEIEFQNVSIRYETNFEPIIRDVNIHIKRGEKIGVCGRTGSGKSSLVGALFRINQICSGKIFVDGLNISKICPHKVRNRLSIIPQDLVLFTGSIRDNLDPEHEQTDDELWRVLHDFRLAKSVHSLDEEVGEESNNERFSSGERQLLCCARAFLRSTPVLIMDESTSLLDHKSEQLVMDQVFRSQKTVIAIAHRISNISNFDKVAVVNDGVIAEFDTPNKLLQNPQSLFSLLYHKHNSH